MNDPVTALNTLLSISCETRWFLDTHTPVIFHYPVRLGGSATLLSLLSVQLVSCLLDILNPSSCPQLSISPALFLFPLLSLSLSPLFFPLGRNPVYSDISHIYTSSFSSYSLPHLLFVLNKKFVKLGRRHSPGTPKTTFYWFNGNWLFWKTTLTTYIVGEIISALRLHFPFHFISKVHSVGLWLT